MPGHLVQPGDFLTGAPPRVGGFECEYDIQHAGEVNMHEGKRIEQTRDSLLLDATVFTKAGITIHDTSEDAQIRWLTNGGNIHLDVGRAEYSSGEYADAREQAAGKVAAMRIMMRLAAQVDGAEVYQHVGTTFGKRTRTVGFHRSGMFPRAALDRTPALPGLLDSFDATSIWAWSGRLGPDGFELGQKARSIGEPTLFTVGQRTVEGKKPMGWIKIDDHDVFNTPDGGWVRSERRVDDAHLSRIALFVGTAADSLVLRIAEHSDKLPKSMPINNLLLKSPLNVLHKVSTDLTMRKAYARVSGKTITALGLQELYADYMTAIAKRVELPYSEIKAIQYLRTVCDQLRSTNVAKGEFTSAINSADCVAHLAFLRRKFPQDAIRSDHKHVIQRSVSWSRIQPDGPAMQFWNHLYATGQATDPMGEALIEKMIDRPSENTRAAIRGETVSNPKLRALTRKLDWKGFVLGDTPIALHPYQTELDPDTIAAAQAGTNIRPSKHKRWPGRARRQN